MSSEGAEANKEAGIPCGEVQGRTPPVVEVQAFWDVYDTHDEAGPVDMQDESEGHAGDTVWKK